MAGRRRRADLPGTRRVAIGPATPQPLAIIAGLPARASQAAAQALQIEFPFWKVITAPFPETFNKTYSFELPVLELLRSLSTFASSQPTLPVPRPAQLMLFYVDAPGSDRLLNAFGYSIMPMVLRQDAWHWPQGRHWRIDINVTLDTLLTAARNLRQGHPESLRLRLERPSRCEALLLPPRNFKHQAEGNLVPRFDRLLQGGDFADIGFDDLRTDRFDNDNLQAFFRHVPERTGYFKVDSRGLVFAISVHGQHGATWAVNIDNIPLADFRYILEGLYRFGTPLRSGFQHDVQWPNDRKLQEEIFFDAGTRAEVPISGDHANIFANDGVR